MNNTAEKLYFLLVILFFILMWWWIFNNKNNAFGSEIKVSYYPKPTLIPLVEMQSENYRLQIIKIE